MLPFGTPGGDVQIQAMLQVFLNMTVFGMDPQQAVEAPRVATYSFPDSFEPHSYYPGRLQIEGRLPRATGDALAALGHQVNWWPELIWRAGAVCAVAIADPDVAARLLQQHPGEVLAAHGGGRVAVDVLQPDQRRGGLGGELGLLLAVHRRGIAPLVAPLGDLGAEAGGDVARDLLDAPLDHVLNRLLEGADGAAQHAFLRDHVPGVAGMDLGGRDDGGVHRVDVARHDRLQRRHDVAAHHHRVDAVMRHGAVGADALHHHLEDVVGGHHRAGPDGEAADSDARDVVHAVDALDRELVEQPLHVHRPRRREVILEAGAQSERVLVLVRRRIAGVDALRVSEAGRQTQRARDWSVVGDLRVPRTVRDRPAERPVGRRERDVGFERDVRQHEEPDHAAGTQPGVELQGVAEFGGLPEAT